MNLYRWSMAVWFLCGACVPAPTDGPNTSTEIPYTTPDAEISWTFEGLVELPAGFHYALWPIDETADGPALVGDGPLVGIVANPPYLTTGRATTNPANIRYIAGVALVVQPFDTDDAPGAVVLAGDPPFDIGAEVTTDHPFAMGADFSSVSGQYVIESFSTAAAEDWFTGIWWVQEDGETPGLTLPPLSDGWVYEGWVIDGVAAYSTGRFDVADAPDADGAGPEAGGEPVPSAPGHDFVALGLDLRGVELWITVEPSQEDDGQPSPWVVLQVPSVEVEAAGVADAMVSVPMPTGTVSLNTPTS